MLLTYGNVKVEENWSVSEDAHSVFIRIYWVKNGNAFFMCNGHKTILKHNHLYCFPNKTAYKIEHDKNNPLECIYLHTIIAPLALNYVAEINLNENDLIANLLNGFASLIKDKPFEIYGTLQQKLTECILLALRDFNIFEEIDIKIASSIQYLLENVNSQINIDDLARISGYHPKYYNELFKKNLGITPHQFIIRHRMKQALSLLQQGKSVVETALTVGYIDEKTFSYAFKKTYGVVPSHANKYFYRNNIY